MARKASFGNTLARRGSNTAAFLYLLLWTNPFCLSLQFSRRESTYSFFFQGHFFKRKKNGDMGSGGEDAQSESKDNEKYQNQQKPVSVSEVKGGQSGGRLRVAVRLSKGPGLPPAALSHGCSSPTQVAPGCVWGHWEGTCGWLGGRWSSRLGRPPCCTLVPEGGGGFISPSPLLPLAKQWLCLGVPLGQRVDGVDW